MSKIHSIDEGLSRSRKQIKYSTKSTCGGRIKYQCMVVITLTALHAAQCLFCDAQ